MASRIGSSPGCWYCIAVRASVCPMTFITIARLPVASYAAVPNVWRAQSHEVTQFSVLYRLRRVLLFSHRKAINYQKFVTTSLTPATQPNGMLPEGGSLDSDFLTTMRALHWPKSCKCSRLGGFVAPCIQSPGSPAIGTVKTFSAAASGLPHHGKSRFCTDRRDRLVVGARGNDGPVRTA